ncbi:type II toxin-antitoxin system HipA family toxin [Streptomyces sp. KM273126]|uniref:type II toxin-antitoxin system HipA family toxin n=1 Tax=Streptomyces sp. KM273126 TaxID=2545247 RepID=UPI00103D5C9B|nr:type II toxin-antitoxin system HipA family toxin [Streptomyces sp. KM273126]MBA2811808.1 type II toxin-antitoxin system HipA family toxin [Streptomyces sp. KM273126]
MTRQTTRARVLLGDRRIGTIRYTQGRSAFEYEDLDPEHPVLGLAFEYNPDLAVREVTGVPNWFANLLPERESALRRIYNRVLGGRASDFLLLVYLGQDLPGAVLVEAEGELPGAMMEALEEAQEIPPKQSLGFSLSGMQLKFSMQENSKEFHLPEPGTLGEWIVKLPSTVLPELPANEHMVMSWAKAIGIDVPEHHLIPLTAVSGIEEDYLEGGTTAFVVRRFDRTPVGRVHQEDFAQVFDLVPADKDRGRQEDIARVLLDNCPQDFTEYLRRIVLCIAAGNNDEHLKNWSLRYADSHTPRLSPAYDLLSATAYRSFQRKGLTLPIAEQGDMRYISRDHFRRFAESLDLDTPRVLNVVDEAVANLRDTLPAVAETAGAPDFLVTHLQDRLKQLPLLRDV